VIRSEDFWKKEQNIDAMRYSVPEKSQEASLKVLRERPMRVSP
jgi:hypothetical protein